MFYLGINLPHKTVQRKDIFHNVLVSKVAPQTYKENGLSSLRCGPLA